MALDTYANLKLAIADWLNKPTILANQIPDFIAIAEKKLNRTTKVPQMFSSFTGNISGTVDSFELPARTKQVVFARLNDSSRTHLHYRTPGQLALKYSPHLTQVPQAYTLMGSDIIDTNLLMLQVGPTPNGAYVVDGIVRKDFEPLASAAGNTNYWLKNAPDLLLFGSLLAATPYLKDDKRLQTWAGMYTDAKQDLDTDLKLYDNPENPTGSTPATTMVV